MTAVRRTKFIALWGVALSALCPVGATAQGLTPQKRSVERRFNIAGGPLTEALNAWSRITGRSIIFDSRSVSQIRSKGVQGRMTDEAALHVLLDGTGFLRYSGDDGSIGLIQDANATAERTVTPDILVTGRRNWSLNVGVERTQDDSQPFIVLTGKEIERSGAPNLETFLRDRLNVNTSPGVGEQAKPGSRLSNPSPVQSSVNLRGIGARDTLILIDGRRQPGTNLGDGAITQTSISGIPIAAIERIEVLASSASGIYGSGASGGVINIILKRDYSGGELSATYGNTTDFAQGDARIDLNYGLPIEGGRTRLSVVGSWAKSLPLLFGDRYEYAQRAINQILARDPNALQGPLTVPPNATTPNFTTSGQVPLRLKPAYGGTLLGSSFGTVPEGYRGLALDGVAPLLAGIGKYNYEPADTNIDGGRRAALIYGTERMSGSLSARREFNKSISGYAGVTLSRSQSTDIRPRASTSVNLTAAAPNNPFVQAVTVSLPGGGGVSVLRSQLDTKNFIGGIIAQLGGGWQSALDLSYSKTRYTTSPRPANLSQATATGFSRGVQDVLRDVDSSSFNYAYDDVPFGFIRNPADASAFTPSLRVAGPIPVSLPGGKPRITFNTEYNDERLNEVRSAATVGVQLRPSYIPSSRQRTWSFYGEMSLPIVGPDNKIPLVREFELRVSGRAERYRGDGANPYVCSAVNFAAVQGDPLGICPPVDAVIARSSTRNSHVDPSVSVRWVPVRPLMFRASYTTGYLPPVLTQLVRRENPRLFVVLGDTARGGERIGQLTGGTIAGFTGGNPNVRPESSRTLSAGFVLTPDIIPGLRFSADWTKIKKRDVYFSPSLLSFALVPGTQAAFDAFIANSPDRVVRGAPSDGFTVGPITSLDLSLVNLLGLSTEAIDFVLDYHHDALGGTLDVTSRATYVDSLDVQTFPGQPTISYAGVANALFASGSAVNGSLRWRGSVAANWSKGPLSLGWAARYFDKYALFSDRRNVLGQGSPYVPSQMYHDISSIYRFDAGYTIQAGINNVINKAPPIDVQASPLYYSSYADPRRRSFYLTVKQSF